MYNINPGSSHSSVWDQFLKSLGEWGQWKPLHHLPQPMVLQDCCWPLLPHHLPLFLPSPKCNDVIATVLCPFKSRQWKVHQKKDVSALICVIQRYPLSMWKPSVLKAVLMLPNRGSYITDKVHCSTASFEWEKELKLYGLSLSPPPFLYLWCSFAKPRLTEHKTAFSAGRQTKIAAAAARRQSLRQRPGQVRRQAGMACKYFV